MVVCNYNYKPITKRYKLLKSTRKTKQQFDYKGDRLSKPRVAGHVCLPDMVHVRSFKLTRLKNVMLMKPLRHS